MDIAGRGASVTPDLSTANMVVGREGKLKNNSQAGSAGGAWNVFARMPLLLYNTRHYGDV